MPGQNSKQMHNIRLSLRRQQQLRQQQLRQQQQLQLQHHQRGCSPSLLLHYYKLPQLPCSRACCLNQIPYAAHFSQENSNKQQQQQWQQRKHHEQPGRAPLVTSRAGSSSSKHNKLAE